MIKFMDIFMAILSIIYITCVFIEVKSLKRNKIDIFYKENFLLVLITSVAFPLAIFALFFGCNVIKNLSWDDKGDIAFSGYFFTIIFASLAYIIHYIKNKIYAFTSRKDKLSFLGIKTIYGKKD